MCRPAALASLLGVYPLWLFLSGLVLSGTVAGLALAAGLGGRRADRSRGAAAAALVLVAGVLALVPAQVGVLLALASYGPDFALERLPLGVPLALVPLVAAAALPGLSRAAGGRPDDRAAGRTAVRVALAGALLGWHLLLVPPTSAAAVLGTGAVYAALLAVSVPLLRPRTAPAGFGLRLAGDGVGDRPG